MGQVLQKIISRGEKNVIVELTLISCGFNIYKYHNKKQRKRNSSLKAKSYPHRLIKWTLFLRVKQEWVKVGIKQGIARTVKCRFWRFTRTYFTSLNKFIFSYLLIGARLKPLCLHIALPVSVSVSVTVRIHRLPSQVISHISLCRALPPSQVPLSP